MKQIIRFVLAFAVINLFLFTPVLQHAIPAHAASSATIQDQGSAASNPTAVQGGLVPACPQNNPNCSNRYDPSNYGPCEFVTLINNVMRFIIGLSAIVGVLVFMYAGFLFVTSQGSPGVISRARSMFTNVVIGFILLLSAFLIVNTILAALVGGHSNLLNWATIKCTYENPVGTKASSNNFYKDAIYRQVASGAYGKLPQCGNSACSVSALQAAGLNSNQANIMSCIAMTESSGVAATQPYNITHPGSNSSACGTFQITKTTWNTAAGPGCANFSSSCQNAQCNAQVMTTLVQRHGYSDWTCANCNAKAQGCINKYGG